MARYIVSGMIRKKTGFSMEVDAKSEKHAERLAITKVGSSQRVKANAVKVSGVRMVK
jgi:ribosomal protein L20A (L18A)